jgi:hypothetical protein
MSDTQSHDCPSLSPQARVLTGVHDVIGVGELACLNYVWVCALARRPDGRLRLAVAVLLGEGAALLILLIRRATHR